MTVDYEDCIDDYGSEYFRCDCCKNVVRHDEVMFQVLDTEIGEVDVFTCYKCSEELWDGI